MSYIEKTIIDTSNVSWDAGGRNRVSSMTSLFDGKMLNEFQPYIFNHTGTGTVLHTNNKTNLTVTAGQYHILQSRVVSPYFSGKSQFVECTFDGFHLLSGITERAGYYSSSIVSPYTASIDGFYLENLNGVISLVAKNGLTNTTTINKPITTWSNYQAISSYDWSKFTVIVFDFLWLGGAVLRVFVKTDLGFVLAHIENYSGSQNGTFIGSPNQPIRYEIRSTTLATTFTYVCSQVSTEGSINEAGYNGSVQTPNNVTIISNTVITPGVSYPIKAIRLKSTYRNFTAKVIGVEVFTNTNDQLMWTLHLNPTTTTPLVFTDVVNRPIQEANGSAVAAITNTIVNKGYEILSGFVAQNQNVPSGLFELDYLSKLGSLIDGTMDTLVLSVTPLTSNINLNGSILYKHY